MKTSDWLEQKWQSGVRAIPILTQRLELSPVITTVTRHLRQVDELIRTQAEAFDPAIADYVTYVCQIRGKGIRPTLALLAGGASGQISEKHLTLATIVELIHLASLIHDDILDRADTRRGQVTIQAKWGPELAVLLGDSLFAHALRLCTQFETNEVAHKIADAANLLCQGEILQTQRQFDLNLTITDYFHIIKMKTAALFSIATELGALLTEVDATTVQNYRRFGEHLGIAYQIYDDCLDLVGTENGSGKTLGTDLIKGKFTLPLLLCLRSASEEKKHRIHSILLGNDNEQRLTLIAGLHGDGFFAESIQHVRKELKLAQQCLIDSPNNDYLEALRLLPDLLDEHLTILSK